MAETLSPQSESRCFRGLPLKCVLSVLAVSLGSLSSGYSLGYPSSALLDLGELPADRAFKKASIESVLFLALLAIGGAAGSVLGAQCSDRVGRRAALLAAGVLGVIGWMLIFIAQYTGTSSAFKSFLLLGRLVTGASAGAVGILVPVYIAEISPPNRRGLLATVYQISITTGIFLSYVVGAIPGLRYDYSALIVTGILMIFLLLLLVIKESPRWLLMKGKRYSAKKSLLWLFKSDSYVDEIIQYIEISLPAKKLSLCEKMKMFTQKSIYHPFLLAIAIVFFHQCTGNNVIIFYAASIFQTANVDHAEGTAIYAIGGLQLVGTIISGFIVDKFGRKKLLLFGSIGIAISNAALGTHFYITSLCHDNSSNYSSTDCNSNTAEVDGNSSCYPSLLSIVPIISVMGFGVFYSIGWRPLPFIMMGEMFPNTFRSTMGGFMTAFLWVLIAILVGGFEPYQCAVGPYTAWWVFAGIALLSVPFVAILLPETKGKTLEEIEQYFDKKKRVHVVPAASNPMVVEQVTPL